MKLIKNYSGLFIVIILSFLAVKPFFIEGFFPIHDDTQVARVFEMGKALKDGMFPVRWVPDLGYGYGYPIFNFYAPLAYYVGGFFTLLGFDALISTKIMMMLGILLSSIFMYLLAREFFGEIGALVSSLFYIYAPYHAVDIYVRGDVAEVWAYAFIPLVFHGLLMVYRCQKWRFVVIGSLGYAGIILSHNLTAMMVTPFILIVTLLVGCLAYRDKKLSSIYYLLSIIFIGLLLPAFYWVPALLEMKYTNVLSQIGGGADFRNHFVCPIQLWDSQWGFGGSAPGCIDGLSFKIGKLHIVLSIVSLLLLPQLWRINKEKFLIALSFIFYLLSSIFIMLEISRFVWEAIPVMAFLQYPWRFLMFSSFSSSILAGFSIWFLAITFSRINHFNTVLYFSTIAFLLLSLLYFNTKLFQPQTILPKTSGNYTSSKALKWTISKISDEYMPKSFAKPRLLTEIAEDKIVVLEGLTRVNNVIEKANQITADLEVTKPAVIRINTAYFPSWKVLVDGLEIEPNMTTRGLIVTIPSGKHLLVARFNETRLERMSNMASVIGIFILLLGIIYARKRLFL